MDLTAKIACISLAWWALGAIPLLPTLRERQQSRPRAVLGGYGCHQTAWGRERLFVEKSKRSVVIMRWPGVLMAVLADKEASGHLEKPPSGGVWGVAAGGDGIPWSYLGHLSEVDCLIAEEWMGECPIPSWPDALCGYSSCRLRRQSQGGIGTWSFHSPRR